MKKFNHFKNLTELGFMVPAIYKIKVQGNIDRHFLDHFSGMELIIEKNVSSKPITTIKGELKDQSALSGLLNALYNLRLAIISVEHI